MASIPFLRQNRKQGRIFSFKTYKNESIRREVLELTLHKITVRIVGDVSPIARTLEEARLACARQEMDKYPAQVQHQILTRLSSRYSG